MFEGVVWQVMDGSPEAEAGRARIEEWEQSLARQYAARPIPRPTYGLWLVLTQGSRREHMVPTVSEVVGMLTPSWERTEERWTAVRTVCGRSGPFESRGWGTRRLQQCRACWALDGAWDGFDG